MDLECPDCGAAIHMWEGDFQCQCKRCGAVVNHCDECGEVYVDASACPVCPACGYEPNLLTVHCPTCRVFVTVKDADPKEPIQCPVCSCFMNPPQNKTH